MAPRILLLLLGLAAAGAHAQTLPAPSGALLLTLEGQGMQVYRCAASGSTPAWVVDHPDATLLDASGAAVGHHFAGPTWRYKDGSEVVGAKVSQAPGRQDGDAPWLLVRATQHHGHGLFTKVETVTRTDTEGGGMPPLGCTAASIGRTQIVPYRARYSFYGKR